MPPLNRPGPAQLLTMTSTFFTWRGSEQGKQLNNVFGCHTHFPPKSHTHTHAHTHTSTHTHTHPHTISCHTHQLKCTRLHVCMDHSDFAGKPIGFYSLYRLCVYMCRFVCMFCVYVLCVCVCRCKVFCVCICIHVCVTVGVCVCVFLREYACECVRA
jgi:hypothetical protein